MGFNIVENTTSLILQRGFPLPFTILNDDYQFLKDPKKVDKMIHNQSDYFIHYEDIVSEFSTESLLYAHE